MKERNGSPDFKDILSGILSKISGESHRGKKPTISVEIIEMFRNAPPEGVRMEDLVRLFGDGEDNEKNRRLVASYVSTLNARQLEGEGVKIQGEIVYHIKSTPENDPE